MSKPPHVNWLRQVQANLKTADGMTIEIWEFDHKDDHEALSGWATHYRQHYCKDDLLADLIAGTGHTRTSYLTSVKFPDATKGSGPATRSGDFGEILLADFAEYVLNYWCPREGRFENRDNRNVPSNGCDVLAFKFVAPGVVNAGDELLLIESKAGLRAKGNNRLQSAIDDSVKDLAREAMSLNAIKQRLLVRDRAAAEAVQRFQNENDRPFRRTHAAAAILDQAVFDSIDLATTVASKHPNARNLRLLVIRGVSMMALVHSLYERAANEA